MSNRIITLFGEEIEPEQLKSAAKPRAKKGAAKGAEDVVSEIPGMEEPEPATAATEAIPQAPPPKAAAEKPITLPEEWSGDKQYYAIGEVAELFKVKTSHIRFWTTEFKIKVRTTRKGDRLYSPDQIKELRAIHHLVKERGFTLTGAKAKLKAQNKMDVETVDLKQSLLQLRNKLVVIRNQIV
jgi:DNA-binding transcriptional MerR regulator